jgi:hypothetical protein
LQLRMPSRIRIRLLQSRCGSRSVAFAAFGGAIVLWSLHFPRVRRRPRKADGAAPTGQCRQDCDRWCDLLRKHPRTPMKSCGLLNLRGQLPILRFWGYTACGSIPEPGLAAIRYEVCNGVISDLDTGLFPCSSVPRPRIMRRGVSAELWTSCTYLAG